MLIAAIPAFFIFGLATNFNVPGLAKETSAKDFLDHLKANYEDIWKPFKPFDETEDPELMQQQSTGTNLVIRPCFVKSKR